MNQIMVLLKVERLQNLYGKSPYQILCYSLKIVFLNKLIEVQAQDFESDNEVGPENEVIYHLDDVILILFVHIVQILENLQFHACLELEFFLVLDDFQCYLGVSFVIMTLQALAEAAGTESADDLVSVGNVVVHLSLVLT